MKILLLGNRGYIGSYLNKVLCDTPYNFELDGIDIGWFSDSTNKKDYRDLTVSNYAQYDVIILLAGHSSVRLCENDMISCFQNNVVNFVGLLEKIKDQKLIYASSSSIYGSMLHNSEVATENRKDYVPVNQYDLSKYVIDQYAKLSGKKYYGLRFGTVNGYSPLLRTDVMINAMVDSARTNGYVKVFNGHINRPILGIQDLCRAVVAIVEGDSVPGIYNLASFNKQVREIASEVAQITNCDLIDERSENENRSRPYDFKIDCSKFCSTFNFQFKETIKSITESLMKNDYASSSRHYKIGYQ